MSQTVFVLLDEPDHEPSHLVAIYATRESAEREVARARAACEEYEKQQRAIEARAGLAWVEPYPAPRFLTVHEMAVSGDLSAQATLTPRTAREALRDLLARIESAGLEVTSNPDRGGSMYSDHDTVINVKAVDERIVMVKVK